MNGKKLKENQQRKIGKYKKARNYFVGIRKEQKN